MNWVGLSLLFGSLGCSSSTVYVVERVESGVWLQSTSLAMVEDAVVWEVQTRLTDRYRAALGEGPSEVTQALKRVFSEDAEALAQIVGDELSLFPNQKVTEIQELQRLPGKYGLPYGESSDLAQMTDVDVGLTPADLEAIRKVVREESKQEKPNFRQRIEELVSEDAELWMTRFAEGIANQRTQRQQRLELEIGALQQVRDALPTHT